MELLVREIVGTNANAEIRELAHKQFHFFRQDRVGTNGQAQSIAKRVSGSAGAARRGLWPGASPRIFTVGPDLALARHAAFFPLDGVVPITSNSPSSTSCTLRRSV